jgi:site-specific recombinase XerD
MLHEIDEFCRQRLAEGCSRKTGKAYAERLERMAAFLRERRLARAGDVSPDDLDAYIRRLIAQGLRKESVYAYAGAARAFFRWLARRGKVLADPSREMLIATGDDEPLPEPPLEESEVSDLMESLPRRDVADLRNRLHLELLYGCGLRLGESLALNVRDAEISTRVLHVRGKGCKERSLPLMGGALSALRDYLALRRTILRGPDHGALLLNRDGKRVTDPGFRRWLTQLNRCRVRQGARAIHPHLLRHSIAVHLLRGGTDIRYIQAFLGHSDLDTTKVYLRLVPGRLKEDYEKHFPEIAIQA